MTQKYTGECHNGFSGDGITCDDELAIIDFELFVYVALTFDSLLCRIEIA